MKRMIQPGKKLFLLMLSIFIVTAAHAKDPEWVAKVGARKTKISTTTLKVNDYGAVNDGKTLNTRAIQKAIDACAAKGGGKVTFAPGNYLTGSLFLKNGVYLDLAKDVKLLGSQDLKDYPEIDTRVAGIEMKWPAALVNIIDQKNSGLQGKGIIDGQGKPFWDAYWKLREEYVPKKLRWIVDYDAKRPRTLLITNCEDITVKDVTFQAAGFWTVHILYSSYVTVEGIIIRNNIGGTGPSTDGIDIDSSSWILVQNCDIDCNDDNFCIKSGRDWDGLRVNRITEYVLIRDCISRKGGGLITFGSETSGGMRHIIARNLVAHGTKVGMRFKSARNRGGVVENIHLENIHMTDVGVALEITPNWNPLYSYSTLPEGYDIDSVPEHWKKMVTRVEPASKGIPTFKDIYISNITVDKAKKAIFTDGLEENPVSNVHLKNININAATAGSIKNAANWNFERVNITAADKTKVEITASTNVKL